MDFSDEEIKLLLEVLVCSKNNEDWRIRRYTDHKRWKKWIDPVEFAQLSLNEIKNKFLEYYNKGMGRYPPIPIQRESIIRDMNRLKETLRFLLNETVPIKERINEILDSDSKYYINGLGQQTITSILMDLNPKHYATWNETTKKGLRFLGRYPEPPRGSDLGTWYVNVMESIEKIVKLKPELNHVEIDHFLYIVSSTPQGENAVNALKNGKLKTLSDCQSIEDILNKPKTSSIGKQKEELDSETNRLVGLLSGLKDNFKKDSIKGIRNLVELEVNYVRNHDKIVSKLKELLNKKGLKSYYTQEIDLLTKEGSKITKVFEIKTDISSSSFQKGIGQLILYTLELDDKPNLFLVLPEAIEKSKQKKLKEQLDIEIIIYNMKGENITFPDLDKKV